jgi:hypothetical protein
MFACVDRKGEKGTVGARQGGSIWGSTVCLKYILSSAGLKIKPQDVEMELAFILGS